MKTLVTGGGGFVGFAIAKMLRARGDDVRTLARGDYPQLAAIGAEQVRGDLADPAVVQRAVAGIEVVFHVAAKAGYWAKAGEFEASNVTGTQNLLDACIDAGVERLVMTSSPAVTFDGDAVNADESLPYTQNHRYEYGRTKAEAERRVLKANATPHPRSPTVLLTCALRPHVVFGPGDPHFVPRVVRRAKAGRLAWIGDGTNLVDFTYVDNVAHAHLLAADALAAEKHRPAGKAYFISQGTPANPGAWGNKILAAIGMAEVHRRVPLPIAYAIGAVLEVAWRAFNLEGEPMMTRFLAGQLGRSTHYDITAARRDLGYEPIVDDDTAFQRTVAWLKDEVAAGRL